jgi:Coenzyme PQQ synthesis protein D (PqqD)
MTLPVSLNSLVQWSDDQIAATVDREIVILSVERGSYYGLDDVGSEIWQQMASPVRVDTLCEALAAKYDADRATIERDVLALLDKLTAEGLISVIA